MTLFCIIHSLRLFQVYKSDTKTFLFRSRSRRLTFDKSFGYWISVNIKYDVNCSYRPRPRHVDNISNVKRRNGLFMIDSYVADSICICNKKWDSYMYFLNIRSENVWFIYFVEFNTFYKVKIHSDNHIWLPVFVFYFKPCILCQWD